MEVDGSGTRDSVSSARFSSIDFTGGSYSLYHTHSFRRGLFFHYPRMNAGVHVFFVASLDVRQYF